MRPGLASALVFLAASPAVADVRGQVSTQGQALAVDSTTPNGSTQATASTLVNEALGLHYLGMPFGPSVALVGAGFEGMNVDAAGPGGALVSGRSASFDLSLGLLPRRAVPLRLYVRGTLSDGGPQSLASFGGRESLAYGLNLNVEPGGALPGLRLDAEENRFTGLNAATLADLRRTVSLSVFKGFGPQQLSFVGRFDQDVRAALGSSTALLGTVAWTAAERQTNLSATTVERNLITGLPTGPSAVAERQVKLSHAQRLSDRLWADASARVGDTTFAAGTGTLGGAGASLNVRPLVDEDLVVALAADTGFTATTGAATTAGRSYGGGTRAGWGRPTGPVRSGVFAGVATQWCGCVGLADGFLTSVEAGVTVATLSFEKVVAQADYRLVDVTANAGRGGNRLEHHARGTSRVRLSERADLNLTASWDDGFRDFIDVTTGVTVPLREQALSGSAGVVAALGRGTGMVDVRHARGSALVTSGTFVGGPPPTATALTHVNATALFPVSETLEVSFGALGSWTIIDVAPPLTTLGASTGLTVRFGRIAIAFQYQFSRATTVGLLTTQHFVRASLARPFEL